ncbi:MULTISPECIES: GTP 3',8-cyclase MoaA [Niallia]|jgi:GTP 3',8-cyclase|uniref:GTP 3',8-cyclase n=1 Tax=Niallia circulans TaxID=1397 RepID=A0AA91TNG4_NIACI|nr:MULTISPECIES: GTP 3',8-cyclase MoaA [Niallia]PAD81283.1 GTP 3',8-cyclase MoaA [Niallia circulans]QJX64571.1 GTP 3',8-cyclase MoaA [Niallia circulans]UTI43238.1 GTP 3',8-cyclase MoaA [Niallia sp. RD1]
MLQDRLGRPLQDLRISVIDRCNFRCTYCMPREIFGKDFSFLPKDQLLSFEEIERLAKLFVQLGVRKIRLTGGEPLLRRDIATLIEKLAAIDGLEDIGLTTNGMLLGKMAKSLKQAGLERVNVSLDALDDKVFQSINDSGIPTKKILDSIEQARKAGLSVKVNMVVKKGMNDQQVIPMAKYFKEQEIPLRYIEFMDVGQTNGWDFSQVLTKKQLFEQLSHHFELEPVDSAYIGEVAKRYRYVGTNAEVGFITSVSESFCSTCTRARLAADGKFYTCLFASGGLDLRTLLRSNADDQTILQSIVPTWKNRNDRYSDERTEESAKYRKKMEMSYIGG